MKHVWIVNDMHVLVELRLKFGSLENPQDGLVRTCSKLSLMSHLIWALSFFMFPYGINWFGFIVCDISVI